MFPRLSVERQAASSAVSKASSSPCDLLSEAFSPASLGAAMATLAARGDASALPLSEDEQDGASPRPRAPALLPCAGSTASSFLSWR